MSANLSLPLSALLPLIQYVFFEPPWASLCLKLQVMALFMGREDHTERKGLAVACMFAFFYFIFYVKTLADCVFVLCGSGGGRPLQLLIRVVHIEMKAT